MNFQATLSQIGKNTLIAVGARDFSRDGGKLIFKVGSKRGEIAAITIGLTPLDEYEVELIVMNTKTYNVARTKREGVYCDNLSEIVRELGDR